MQISNNRAEKLLQDDEIYWTPNQTRMLRYMLESDGMQFMRYFFKLRENTTMLRNWHHYVIEYVLQAVIDGKINRLIINIAPGYTKTELAVLNFIARGLALNPRAKFIHASYSADLAKENSSKIKDTVISQPFQQLWPMEVRTDTKAKGRWFTELGGGMMAVASGGQIAGFRAGRMEPGFTGAFINDDPLKPEDAYSQTKRTAINNRMPNTMKSRLALETIPLINIMQRLHEDDLSGFLLRGGSGDIYHHLVIPAKLDEVAMTTPYPEDYTHGKKIELDGILKSIHNGEQYAF